MSKKKNEVTIRSSAAEYLTYVASTGDNPQNIEIRYEDENIWLTQKVMAKLYDVTVPAINYHVNKIFRDSELQRDSVIKKFLITAEDVRLRQVSVGIGRSYKKRNKIGLFRGEGGCFSPTFTPEEPFLAISR